MDINCAKGEKVILTDKCRQTFKGTIKSVNSELGRILLTDITLLPDERPIKGHRNFDRIEIVELRKLDDDILESEKEVLEEDKAKEPTSKLPQSQLEHLKKIQKEFQLIRDLETNFHSAVSLLKASPIIGVLAKDTSKGRFGRASVLVLSTPSNVFIFDLLTLGDEAFHRGLKEVFESEATVKVVHDGRLLSDCLKHKHSVKLENVRDVEAEDVMVVYQERRSIRRHSRSLAYLCRVYLGVEVKEGDVEGEGEGERWEERPLPGELVDFLVSSASLLLPLQEAIERKYLRLLADASNLYNTHLRDLDFFDFLYNQPKKTLKKELGKLLTPQNQVRGDFAPNTNKPHSN